MDPKAIIRRLALACAMLCAATSVIAQGAPPEGPAVWTFLAGLPRDQRLAVLEREAKREGGFTIYGALGIDRAQILDKIFNERYPDVNATEALWRILTPPARYAPVPWPA